MTGFNTHENELRWKHAQEAAQRAFLQIVRQKTFEALSAIQEAEIILQAIYKEENKNE